MRTSPSISPHEQEQDTYLVLDDFGEIGRAWREMDEYGANRERMIRYLVTGEFNKPVRVVAFNTSEGWSRDVSGEIADELRQRYAEFGEVPDSLLEFMEANVRR